MDSSALGWLVNRAFNEQMWAEDAEGLRDLHVRSAFTAPLVQKADEKSGAWLASWKRKRKRGGRRSCPRLPPLFHARCLVRQWLYVVTSVLVAFGATPCIRKFFARCWVLLRSKRTTTFWETTQCFHISAMLGTTVGTFLRESTWFLAGSSLAPYTWQSPVRCLPRRVQENWIFRCHSAALMSTTAVVFSGLVLLVKTDFALRFFYCSQALMFGIIAGMDQMDSFVARESGGHGASGLD